MNLPSELRYVASHEWVRLNDDGTITIGVTDHAQEQLGDLVFVETPEIDATFSAGDAIAVLESVKAASDIYAPVAGVVLDTNGELADSPELINDSPYENGWIFTMRPDDATEIENLLSADDYEQSVADEG